ncbi:1-phosphofructokinase [Leptolyngbya sp. AN02str]|uniref:1-phosphofructokinase n=1 Tax=Leptolyngbya sp. AN02str TaxID=3423363 RepID=UPI003D30F7C8
MANPRIATVTLNPAIDETAAIPHFRVGEVNRVDWSQLDPGGKGVNVASFLSDFGFGVSATGFLGNENAKLFRTLFALKGIADRFVLIPGQTRINFKIIDEALEQVTDINFPGQTPVPDELAMLHRVIDELAIAHDWFVLGGSLPVGVPEDIYYEITLRLKAQNKTVVLDASGPSFKHAIAASPYAIKPNLEELEELLGTTLTNEMEVVSAARELVQQGITCVTVSMGPKGAIFVEADEAVWAIPPHVEIVSTVGAGDAIVSGLITGILHGQSLSDRAQLATGFSMGALTQLGPRLPSVATIEDFAKMVTLKPL